MDLSTPNDHERYREIKSRPEEEWSEPDRKHVDWMEGRDVPGRPPRYYTGTPLKG